mgnify:CR=1 FL=1
MKLPKLENSRNPNSGEVPKFPKRLTVLDALSPGTTPGSGIAAAVAVRASFRPRVPRGRACLLILAASPDSPSTRRLGTPPTVTAESRREATAWRRPVPRPPADGVEPPDGYPAAQASPRRTAVAPSSPVTRPPRSGRERGSGRGEIWGLGFAPPPVGVSSGADSIRAVQKIEPLRLIPCRPAAATEYAALWAALSPRACARKPGRLNCWADGSGRWAATRHEPQVLHARKDGPAQVWAGLRKTWAKSLF